MHSFPKAVTRVGVSEEQDLIDKDTSQREEVTEKFEWKRFRK